MTIKTISGKIFKDYYGDLCIDDNGLDVDIERLFNGYIGKKIEITIKELEEL